MVFYAFLIVLLVEIGLRLNWLDQQLSKLGNYSKIDKNSSLSICSKEKQIFWSNQLSRKFKIPNKQFP